MSKLQENLKLAMSRQVTGNKDEILFPLSGGLDSRWVISLADKSNIIKPLTSFTMGEDNSEDIIYAKMIASKLGLEHFTYKISPLDIWRDAKKFSYISDAMSLIYGPTQIYEPLKSLFHNYKITLISQMCDAVFGSTLHRRRLKTIMKKKKFDNESENIMINIFSIYQNKLERIFQRSFLEKIKNNYRHVPEKYIDKNRKPIHAYFNLLMNEHGRRGTLCGNIVTNLFYETRMPSYDNELMNFAYKLPLELRKNQFVYRFAFSKMFPELASIPRESNSLPINTSDFRLNMKILENNIIIKLKSTPMNKILQNISKWNKSNYVNYKEWFNNELRQNIENIILDKKTFSRGIYNENGVRNLLFEHYSTRNDHSKLIWQIINLEYFFRNFID